MPHSTRKSLLEAGLKGLLAAVDTTWWLKASATVIAELSGKVEDLPPDQQEALLSATPEQIEEVLSQLDLTSQNVALAAAGVARVEEQLGSLIGWVKKHKEKEDSESAGPISNVGDISQVARDGQPVTQIGSVTGESVTITVHSSEREKRSQKPSPEQKLALQEEERWSFALGKLCFLLGVFTHFHRRSIGSSERLEDVRRDTLRHLKRFCELDDSFVKSADGREIMNAAHDAMGHHVGRVENAFTLGLLIQQFELRSVEAGASQEERLKSLAGAQRKIWTPDAIFLPENDDLRTAARTIYDYVEKGMYPAKKEAQDLERILMSCYAP